MKPSGFKAEIKTTICGIPCIIGVTTYYKVRGSFSWNAPSDLDYYGYTEIEFDILDRKGYSAPWLERKMTDDIRVEIETMIEDYYAECDQDEY